MLIGPAMQQLISEKIETSKGYTEIEVGVVKLVSEYKIILHKINPERIKDILEHFRNNTADIKDTHYKKLLNVEINATESMKASLNGKREVLLMLEVEF